MTFATPWALLALLLLPLVVPALVLAGRRRLRYAIRYPALDVLAGVVERERRGRWIPAALLVLALTALLLGAAKPMERGPVPPAPPPRPAPRRGQADGPGARPPRRGHGHAGDRRVRLDERRRRRADPDGGGPAGGQPVPRPPARALPGGPGHLLQRGRDPGAADHRP